LFYLVINIARKIGKQNEGALRRDEEVREIMKKVNWQK
jgi:hypothetical protein